MRGFPAAAACLLGAATASACLTGAAAAPRAQDTLLTVRAAGDRTGPAAGAVTGAPLPAGMVFTVRNAGGTVLDRCTTAAGGTCTLSVPTSPQSQTYTVTQSAVPPPSGWFSSDELATGTSAVGAARNYSQVSVTVPANAASVPVPPTGSDTSTNYAFRSGYWAVSRDNPPEPAACGLNVALLFDLSGSVGGNLGLLKQAGVGFVQALAGTPSHVALYTFAYDAPANASNNNNYPLTSVQAPADAAPLITRINGFTSSGGTNWDQGIWQIAAAARHYDVAVVLTDGNPTNYGNPRSGPSSYSRFNETEYGIFSANALKAKGTRIIAVGIGAFTRLPGSLDNLAAISGKTAGSDYLATSFAELGPLLKRLALTNCAGIEIKKSAEPDTYDAHGQQIHYTYTVTNTGAFFTLHDITVTDDKITGPVHCAATTLAPGEHTTCTATYVTTQLNVDEGRVTNTAFATGTTPNDDEVPSGLVKEIVPARRHPAISIVKTASVHSFNEAGLVITYFYRVTNTGNVSLIATARDNTAAPLVCPRSVLSPGRSMTCRSFHVVTEADIAAGHIPNLGLTTGVAPDGTEVHADDQLNITEVHAPEISIVKTASVDSFAAPGTPVTYYYLVSNNGNVTLDPVTVTDSRGLPVSCPHASLAPGAEMTCTARHVTTQADVDRGTIANTGTVTGRTPGGAEVTDRDRLDLPVVPGPAVAIVKTASVTSFTAAGQVITYSYLVTNNGDVALHGLTVTDSRGLALSCPGTRLAAAEAMTCTARYLTTQGDAAAGAIFNIATVRGRTPSGAGVLAASSALVRFAGFFFPVTG